MVTALLIVASGCPVFYAYVGRDDLRLAVSWRLYGFRALTCLPCLHVLTEAPSVELRVATALSSVPVLIEATSV